MKQKKTYIQFQEGDGTIYMLEDWVTLKHGGDPDEKFDPVQLQKGIEYEKRVHTEDVEVATQIAKGNLAYNKRFYEYLERVEPEK